MTLVNDRVPAYLHNRPALWPFLSYSTRLAFDYFNIRMVFAIERLKFILCIRTSICNLTIFEPIRTDPHLTKWYLHWTVLDYLGIWSFTSPSSSKHIPHCATMGSSLLKRIRKLAPLVVFLIMLCVGYEWVSADCYAYVQINCAYVSQIKSIYYVIFSHIISMMYVLLHSG